MLFSLLLACMAARPLDAAPTHTVLDTPRPAGDVYVALSPYTGGDQGRRMEAGLLLTVEAGAHRYEQIIASCESVGVGSPFLPEPDIRALAQCGDRDVGAYERDGAIVAADMRGEELARIALP